MIFAEAIKAGIDPLAWEVFPRIHLGPLAISPHGIGIAVGYLAGAQLMVRRARKYGGPREDDIWNVLFYALLGAIVGARVGYVIGHLGQVTNDGSDLLGIFRVWEGGISLLGGITGAILAALPYAFRHKMGFWRMMDLAVPGLALGIVIGRIGDLIIGDHLGKPTSFPLGWHCLGSAGAAPVPAQQYLARLNAGDPPSLGCFDLTLHQTALYDFFSTLVLLVVLVWLGRKVRNAGFLTLFFTIWYGSMRMITDFLRVDRRYLGLTGSQITSLLVGLTCLYLLARFRGAPPRWQAQGGPDPNATAESDLKEPEDPLPPTESDDNPTPPAPGVAR
ncbi:MAG: phosphatidylglycerol---prolipoprotein diacylglyceryl transferase [Actinomycetota bacterium]|nr:phosphatidylglycerol---prolipoprotein diacylglyceryl transferase [Actinomycetota bacterium]